MKAAWYLRSRQILDSLRFWVAITGYDIRDRSGSGQLYLLYLIAFFGVWGLAMLALVASAVARGLLMVAPAAPAQATAVILAAVFFVWWAYTLIGASRRSPLSFSAEDAALICATPVARPGVVFAWLASEWALTGVPLWGLGVVLGFSLSEIALDGASFWEHLPAYLSSGLRFFPPAFLLHLALLSLAWALGCLRLQGGRERPRLWIAAGVILMLLLGGGVQAFSAAPQAFAPARVLITPFLAGAGLSPSAPALLPVLAAAILSPLLLWLAARRLNLARAAQETENSHGALARLVLDSETAETAALKRRLKKGHAPSRVPRLSGARAIVWKHAVQLSRGWNATQLGELFMLFAVAAGALFAPDWASRSLLSLYWVVSANQFSVHNLRKDLRAWQIFQSLPLRPVQRLWSEILPAVLALTLTGWAALAVAAAAGWQPVPWLAYVLLPGLAAVLAACAALDVVRQTRAEHLATGNIPAPGVLAVVLAALVLAADVYLLALFSAAPAGLLPLLLLHALLLQGLNAWFSSAYREAGK